MPEVIPGTDTQQKTVTVAADDFSMNNQIATEAADTPGWIVSQLILNGANMVILFQRNVPVTPP